MDCTICHKPVNLIPSAGDRAARFGGKPADYVRLFTTHPACTLRKRQEESAILTEQLRERRAANVVKLHSRSGDQSTLGPVGRASAEGG